MDILVLILVFVIGLAFGLIGLSKRHEETPTGAFFLIATAVIFMILGFAVMGEGVRIISGVSTVENVTSVNVTELDTDFKYAPINPFINTLLGMFFVVISLFFLFYGVLNML